MTWKFRKNILLVSLLFTGQVLAEFTDVTQETGVSLPKLGAGIAVADFNQDGRPDFYVVNQGDNFLYQNQAGIFKNIAATAGVTGNSTSQAAGAFALDYNNDGLPDILTWNPLALFKNLGNDRFENVTVPANVVAPAPVTGCAPGDYNSDGFPDLYLVLESTKENLLLRNSGPPHWRFMDRGSVAKVHSHAPGAGAIFFDYNNDGRPDLYVINKNTPNHLYQNQGDSTFVDVAAAKSAARTGLFTGVTTADYDNDGDIDLYLTVAGGPNLLLKNSGAPDFSFQEVAVAAGVAQISNGYTAAFGDLNNDGWPDLYVSSGFENDALYRNRGDGTFQNVAASEKIRRPGGEIPTLFDFNQDGQLDIYVVNALNDNVLYQNSGENHWLKIQLVGQTATRQAFGARIRALIDGIWQTREINGHSPGAYGGHALPEQFGLGNSDQVDSLEIRWPNGKILALRPIPANQLLIIPENETLPEAPELVAPAHQSFTNQNQPVFEWQAVPDADQDSLHFIVEIAEDPAFTQMIHEFNSAENATGFMTPLPAASFSGPVQFRLPEPLADGIYWWRVQVDDGLSRRTSPVAFQFTVDTQPPDNPAGCLELGGAVNRRWQNFTNSPVFHLAPDSTLSGYYFYFGTNPRGEAIAFQDSSVFRLGPLTDGIYYFRVRARDLAGNPAPDWQTVFTFQIDQTPPEGTTAWSVARSDTPTFYIHWENSARDLTSGLTGHYRLQVQTDEAAWLEFPLAVTGTDTFFTGEINHRYGFEVAAQDSAGNWEAFRGVPETVTLIDPLAPDLYPPLAPRNLSVSRQWQRQPEFELNFELPYDRSGIDRFLFKLGQPPESNGDTTGSAPVQRPFVVSATAENGQGCYVWLRDRQGNADFRNRSQIWLRWDQTAPVLENVKLESAHFGTGWYNPNRRDSLAIEFSLNELRPQTALVSIDGVEFTRQPLSNDFSAPVSFPIHSLSDGRHEFEFIIQDSAANQTSARGEFFTDQTPPTGTHPFSPSVSNTLAFKVSWFETGSDPASGLAGIFDVYFQRNDEPWQVWLSDFRGETALFTGEQGQQYAFEVAAFDNVGNREILLQLAESQTRVDTTRQLSPVPPEQTQLAAPLNGSFLNLKSPQLTWQTPVDLNRDPLHFRVELARDSLFRQNLLLFESQTSSSGFTPAPPMVAPELSVQFQLPVALTDGRYWWRVRAWDGQFYGQPSAARSFTLDTVLPDNPVTCSDSAGAPNDRWQNQFRQPHFVWSGAGDVHSGLAGFRVYFGADSSGAADPFISENQFSPGEVSSGLNYLRVRSQDRAGNLAADWATLFRFKFDDIPPRNATAQAAEMSSGPTFPVCWANTAIDSGGSGLSGLFDVWVRRDTSGTWSSWLEQTHSDTILFTGEIGHHYSFEVAAWDLAGNREPLWRRAETTLLCAPVNAPPDAPLLVEPINQEFISLEKIFRWNVPTDPDLNPLHFKIEFSRDSLFQTARFGYESKKDSVGFTQVVAASGSGDVGFLLPTRLIDGDYWWRVSAWDGWIYGPASQPAHFVIDQTPPEIFAVEKKNVVLGQSTKIEFTARDSLSGVQQQRLIYRIGGNPDSLTSTDLEIPVGHVTARGLEYALLAVDKVGNVRRQPVSGFWPLPVFVDGDGVFVESTNWRFGESPQAYRMLSVPLQLSGSTPAAVLADDFGAYDIKKWRLFDFENSQFREFQSISDGFTPGNAFWLISRYPVPRIDSGPGQTVATTEPFRVAVDSATWTMFGNPFNFSVALEYVFLENGQPLTNLITYQEFWKISSEITHLAPWEGYMVKSSRPTYLSIMPFAAEPVIPAKAVTPELAPGEWQVQLEARCGEARDPSNFAGVKKMAAVEWDAHDLFEPPLIGEFISLRFAHSNWSRNPDFYTTDFQPTSDTGNFWDFEVMTSYENQPVALHLTRQDSIPENFSIQLVDKRLKTLYYLNENPVIHFASGAAGSGHVFRLLIGTEAFLAENNLGAGALPEHFQLYQNFPNPFNSQTLIRFVLPEPDEISISIYNVLGQEVTRLLNHRKLETGFYEFRWDAANATGQSLASGIYLCQLHRRSGKFSKTLKMVLTK